MEQVALGMAAAHGHQLRQGQAQLRCRHGPVSGRMREQAMGRGHADLLPHAALVRLGAAGGVGLDVVQQCARCIHAASARQAVEVLQV
ncbi:hypothetical protein D3C87_2040820 [compost metagenome]